MSTSKLARLTARGGATARESIGAARSSPPAPRAPGEANGAFRRAEGTVRASDFLKVELARIAPDPAQPRRTFDPEELRRLADSMAVFGQLQAIRVYYDDGPDVYRIVAGERRWRAASIAGLASLSCQVVPRPEDDPSRIAQQILENTARADLAPVERADAIAQLRDRHNWTVREIAQRTGLSRSSVAEDLALAGTPDSVRALVAEGSIPRGAALQIARLPSALNQRDVAEGAWRGGMTAAAVGEWVDRILGGGDPIGDNESVSDVGHGSTTADETFAVRRGSEGIIEAVEIAPPHRAPAEPPAHDEPPAPTNGAAADRGLSFLTPEEGDREARKLGMKMLDVGASRSSDVAGIRAWDYSHPALGAVHAIPTRDVVPLLEAALAEARRRAPPAEALDAALVAALKAGPGGTEKWLSFRLVGALSDDRLLEAIGNCWESEPCAATPLAFATKGGMRPAIWLGTQMVPKDRGPDLKGADLVARVRKLMGIGRPGER